MLFLAASKGNYFQQWTPEHDVVMRSPDRGQIWENIAAALNSLQQLKFRVTASQELFQNRIIQVHRRFNHRHSL